MSRDEIIMQRCLARAMRRATLRQRAAAAAARPVAEAMRRPRTDLAGRRPLIASVQD